MTLNLDAQRITLTCPQCSKQIEETIGRLKRNPTLPCPGCKTAIKIKADELRRSIQTVEKSLDSLRKSLGKIGK